MKFYTDHAAVQFEHLGEYIRDRRQSRGYTQRELAGVSGVGLRFLSELERGKPNVDLNLVLKVLASLGCDLLLHDRSLMWPPQPMLRDDPDDV
ncbi:MAG: transcriptional regulator [Xanthomonadaceae bacterium]|nr:transcriptional regulator [Xanthomonadaceae bacterium]